MGRIFLIWLGGVVATSFVATSLGLPSHAPWVNALGSCATCWPIVLIGVLTSTDLILDLVDRKR